MFPNVKHIAALVRNKRVVDHLEDVTIMFSDLKGYTEWASTESPREVYRVLNKVQYMLQLKKLDAQRFMLICFFPHEFRRKKRCSNCAPMIIPI